MRVHEPAIQVPEPTSDQSEYTDAGDHQQRMVRPEDEEGPANQAESGPDQEFPGDLGERLSDTVHTGDLGALPIRLEEVRVGTGLFAASPVAICIKAVRI